MSEAARRYCQRRLDAIDRAINERRPYAGPIWPSEHGEAFDFIGRTGPGVNVDDLLELRIKWERLLERAS